VKAFLKSLRADSPVSSAIGTDGRYGLKEENYYAEKKQWLCALPPLAADNEEISAITQRVRYPSTFHLQRTCT